MCKDDRRVSFPDASRLTWIVTCCNGEGFENFHYRGIGTDYGEGPFGYDVISHGIGPIANSRALANHLLHQHREIVRQCKNSQFHFTHAVVAALLVGGAGQGALMSMLTNTLVNGTPAANAGDAGAMRGAVINLSAGVGTALAAAISVAFLTSGVRSETRWPHASGNRIRQPPRPHRSALYLER